MKMLYTYNEVEIHYKKTDKYSYFNNAQREH